MNYERHVCTITSALGFGKFPWKIHEPATVTLACEMKLSHWAYLIRIDMQIMKNRGKFIVYLSDSFFIVVRRRGIFLKLFFSLKLAILKAFILNISNTDHFFSIYKTFNIPIKLTLTELYKYNTYTYKCIVQGQISNVNNDYYQIAIWG